MDEDTERLALEKNLWKNGIPEHLYNLSEIAPKLDQGAAGYSGALVTMLLASEEKDRLAILKRFGWGVGYEKGFAVVANPHTGERFLLNRPGMSKNDFVDFLMLGVQFTPAAGAAAGVGRGAAKLGSWTLLKINP